MSQPHNQDLALYDHENLADLLARYDTADEDHAPDTDCDREIQAYTAELHLQHKVDAAGHVMTYLDSQINQAEVEMMRLKQRVSRFTVRKNQLINMAALALNMLAEPRIGRPRQLEGAHTTLILRTNPPRVEILNVDEIPDEYKVAELTMPLRTWGALLWAVEEFTRANLRSQVSRFVVRPVLSQISAALQAGVVVPGAALEQGFRVERR